MIEKLQYRFILITMSCIGVIFLLILLALNIFMTAANYRQGYAMLEDFSEHPSAASEFSIEPKTDSDFNTSALQKNTPPDFASNPPVPDSDPDTSDTPKHVPGPFNQIRWFNDVRIFQLSYDSEHNFLGSFGIQNPNLTEEDFLIMGNKALENTKQKGRISNYLYLVQETESSIFVYFLDYSPEKSMSAQLLKMCSWIGLGGMMILFIPVLFLSRWVTKPVQTAFDKQKQFIADASHELKTPLAIITTNAEVLETSIPENKWLHYILEQTDRMKTLIGSLLDLAKLDACEETSSFTLTDLSKTVRNASLSFESLAYEQGKKFTMEIEDNLYLQGCESQIKQLVTILLDNAFKYTDDHGSVLISLSKQGEKKQLLVHNTGKGIAAKDQKRIFERFYRSDSSRNRESGGYGLGLSIAESIVKSHKGQIHVKSDGESYTEFVVTLP